MKSIKWAVGAAVAPATYVHEKGKPVAAPVKD